MYLLLYKIQSLPRLRYLYDIYYYERCYKKEKFRNEKESRKINIRRKVTWSKSKTFFSSGFNSVERVIKREKGREKEQKMTKKKGGKRVENAVSCRTVTEVNGAEGEVNTRG